MLTAPEEPPRRHAEAHGGDGDGINVWVIVRRVVLFGAPLHSGIGKSSAGKSRCVGWERASCIGLSTSGASRRLPALSCTLASYTAFESCYRVIFRFCSFILTSIFVDWISTMVAFQITGDWHPWLHPLSYPPEIPDIIQEGVGSRASL